MRIKLDENLPGVVRELLLEAGHDVQRVVDEGLTGALDPDLWSRISPERRLFITLDRDFGDVRRYPPGSHCGIVLLRLARSGPNAVADAVRRVFSRVSVDELVGALIVVGDDRIRVRTSASGPEA